jgi:hypothetical protein
MTPLAHVSGIPVEELMLPLLYGGGSLWLALRASVHGRRRHTRAGHPDRQERSAR